MKKLVKPISIVLAIAYLMLIPVSAFASVGAVSVNSVNSLLSKWQSYGLVDSSINNNDLNNYIQKIDFIKLINGIMKPTKKAEIGFIDVPKESWYGEEISKAVAAGYIDNKDKAKFNPFSDITRLEAAVMVKRVFGLELKDKRILTKITDAETLNSEELNDFGAVIEKGCLTQVSEGRYAPTGILKLYDSLKMLDICVGQVVTKSGTLTNSVSGNMLINVGAVTLKDMNISGDLTIGEGVGDGDVKLDGVSINGKLVIRGGGPNSVTLTNTRIDDFLVIDKSAGNVHVKTSGATTIDETYVKSGCFLEESGLTGEKGFVDIITEKSDVDSHTVDLKGEFDKLAVTESNMDIKLNGKAENVNISKGATSNFTLSAGSVKTITSQASQNIIDILGGTVSTLNIDAGAIGNKLNISGTTTISNINIKENTTINFFKGTIENLTLSTTSEGSKLSISSGAYLKNIVANAGATIAGSGSITNAYMYASNISMSIKPSGEYIKGGSNTTSGSTDTNSNLPKITISNIFNRTIPVGSNSQKLNAYASNGAEKFYSSSDNSIVTVSDKGVLTGVSVGTTTVNVTAQKDGYTPAVATITVNVVSGNVTSAGTLTVSPTGGTAGEVVNVNITYTTGENMTSGRIVIKLPAGFKASESDAFSINSGAETALTNAYIIDASTLSFNNIALAAGDTIEVRLKNKVIPTVVGGQVVFSAIADADGMGPKIPAGEVSCVFTSDSLKILQGNGVNYSTPEYGSKTGTTKISTLSFVNVNGATKWIISDVVTIPTFDQVLTGTDYAAGQDIQAAAGQQLMLAAVDAANKVKAYAIITIQTSMIRPDDATTLDPATIVVNPGIEAGTIRIEAPAATNISGASVWMYKVQDAPSTTILNGDVFAGDEFISDKDIKVTNSQYIVLAAVDSLSSKKVKAYVNIPVSGKVSVKAGDLVAGINYSVPSNGTSVGAIKIDSLTIGGISTITDWKYVVLSKTSVIPAQNVTTSAFEIYTEGQSFKSYLAGENISASDGQHLLLVGTDTASKIVAYADITIESDMVREEDASDIPDTNFTGPVMGTNAGTTMFTYLSPNLSGSALSLKGWKYKYSIQNSGLAVPPQINSKISGAEDCMANTNIPIDRGQNKHLILLITDANGRIKAYKDIAMNDNWIRPENALKLEISQNDYAKPAPGTTSGAIKVDLSSNRVGPAFSKWMYKLSDKDIEIPYIGSEITGISDYTSGADIKNVTPGAYLLIIAVDGSGKTLAYLKEQILYDQIKQPDAGLLKSNVDVIVNYNYSVPEPGPDSGKTMIKTLSLWGIQDATKWRYRVSATVPPTTVEYNSVVTSYSLPYYANLGVTINDDEYLVLYAVDSKDQVKAFKNIQVSAAQIKTPDAPELKLGINYTTPSAGTTQGAIAISILSFNGLDSSQIYTGWTWRYVVGNAKFGIPAKNSSISTVSGTAILTTTTDIMVTAKQYVLLLAVDNGGIIRGYANIYVDPGYINPGNADQITPVNYHLTKGTAEGMTSFDKLETVGLDSTVSAWMIKVQAGSFANTYPKNTAVNGSYVYKKGQNIAVHVGDHILLLATDSLGKVKAFADIEVKEDDIQAPFALDLVLNKNFTIPVLGDVEGTVRMVLQETDIPKASGDTIVWKYKKSVFGYRAHLNDSAPTGSGQFTECESNKDMKVDSGYWLLVATIGDKVKAYTVIKVDDSMIKPSEVPALELDKNYKAPVPGTMPGTTKITGLTFMNVAGAENCIWQVKVVNSDEKIMSNSTFTGPDINNYTSGNITAKVGQFIVLAAVDKTTNKVKAYKNIKVEEGTVNAPELKAGENFSALNPGTAKGTTSVFVSPDDTKYVVKVVDNVQNITAGSIIAYDPAPVTDNDYSNYNEYISGSNIKAEAGQYILIIAVDGSVIGSGKALAYANIQVVESSLRPGDATILKPTQNYSALQPGTGVGTVKITYLDFFGLPLGDKKWVVRVEDTSPAAVAMNSSVNDPKVDPYEAGKDIAAREGQYVVLYAVDKATNKVKGYAVLEVKSDSVRGVAPLLQISSPVLIPGPALNTTIIDVSKVSMPSEATTLKYIVQNNAAGTILKDGTLTGMTANVSGTAISVLEGQHLILAATDTNGLIKAYADILVDADDIRSIIATLGGSLVTKPVDETKIAAGGETITITLDSAEWQDDILTNKTKRDSLYGGFKASGTESAKWDTVITVLKNEGTKAVSMSTDKKTIYITLSEAVYDITTSQDITLTISASANLIKGATKDVVSKDIITIAANAVVQVSMQNKAGSTITSFGVGDIQSGNAKIILTLPNGQFASDVKTVEDKRNAIFDGLEAAINTPEWDEVITALKLVGESAINRNASNKVTITLPAVPGYNINTFEAISVTVPCKTPSGSAILVGAINNAVSTAPIKIYPNVQATLAGTLVAGQISERDIVTGGKTLTITLKDGQWVSDITSKAKREALYPAMFGPASESNQWTKVITALNSAGEGAISLVSSTAIEINLPSVTGYDITADQEISIKIPASYIVGAQADLIAGQVTVKRVASATLSGTATGTAGISETDLKLGGKTVIITLNGATWVNDIETNKTVTDALFDGFLADVDKGQWANVVAALKNSAVIKKTAANAITIELPTLGGVTYDLTSAKQTISLTVPTSAAIGTNFDIRSTNSIVINNTPPTAAKVKTVTISGSAITYKTDDIITIKVEFDTAVDVIGKPTLKLNINKDAVYTTKSAINVLNFEYKVQAGDATQKLDYLRTTSLTLPTGTTIVNSGSSVLVNITLPAPGSTGSIGDPLKTPIVIDAVAPKFATSYPKKGIITENTAEILVNVGEEGKVYFIVVPVSSNTTTTAEQIVAEAKGDITGSAIEAGSISIAANTEGILAISGLSAYTNYSVYIVAEDILGNKGAVSKLDFATKDTTPPVFDTGYPVQKEPKSDNKIEIDIKTNELGTAYVIALPVGSAKPSSAQVMAGKNANNVTVPSNLKTSGGITTAAGITLTLSGLPVSTSYDIYVVCSDLSSPANVTSPVCITAETSKLNLDNVGVDLSQKKITNTTTQMEFSFDKDVWSPCSSGSTTISYDDNADDLTIYVREKLNTTNIRQLGIFVRNDKNLIDVSLISYDILNKTIRNASTVNLQYRINGGAWGALNASSSAISVTFVPGKLEVRTAVTQTTLPSIAVEVDVITGQDAAPELDFDDDANVIAGLNGTYEYRIGTGIWTSGSVKGDFSGTKDVEVRKKATSRSLPSKSQIIHFTPGYIEVVAAPATETGKRTVTITFEENTNMPTLANIKNWLLVGAGNATTGAITTPHNWGDDFTAKWTGANIITLEYTTLSGAAIVIGDVVNITTGASIKNAAGTTYTSKGVLTGSFNTVPSLANIKAMDSGTQTGLGNNDSIVITFDQAVKEGTVLTKDNIGTFLTVKDKNGVKKANAWKAVTTNASIVWNTSRTALTIIFDNVAAVTDKSTLLAASDKIIVETAWGLTDADVTTDVCNASLLISGSFTTAPAITGVNIISDGTPGLSVGDSIKITFSQPTNEKQITQAQLRNYFKILSSDKKTAHSWGYQDVSGIAWNAAGTELTITISNTTGVTLVKDDLITLDASADIMDEAEGVQAVGKEIVVGGSY